jgi:Family of unknown function (DUF5343)
MATTHPYITSSGSIVQIVTHLRRSFPSVIDAGTIKRLGIAPKNESYLVNILRFLGLIDDEGKKTTAASKIFAVQEDKFHKEFADVVKAAYKPLFDDHGEAAWKLDTDRLITFFRQTDDSGAVVGARQANTFRTLSALSGYADIPQPRVLARKSGQQKIPRQPAATGEKKHESAPPPEPPVDQSTIAPFGLTVRVEVNLPADADQETYDKIFQSIRKNLIDRK